MKFEQVLHVLLIVGLVVGALVFTTIFILRVIKAHKASKPKEQPKEQPVVEEKAEDDLELEEMKQAFKDSIKPEEIVQPQKKRKFVRLRDSFKVEGRASEEHTDESTSFDSEISLGSIDQELDTEVEEHTKYELAPRQIKGESANTKSLKQMIKNSSPEIKMLILSDILKTKF